MYQIKSFVNGEWKRGSESSVPLLNPATEEIIGEVHVGGFSTNSALEYAREVGGKVLRGMTFRDRGKLLLSMSSVIHGNREELFSLATANGGNTRKDAKFDVDGAWQTLAYYGNRADELGDLRYLVDGEDEALGQNPRWCGRHIWTPRHGVAVHVNAFNFPAWGFAEKAATAILAGMPVVTKPATSTSLVAFRITELFVESGVIPPGVFSLIAGGGRDLLDHVNSQDVVAFTGGSSTAAMFRNHPRVVEQNVRLSIEADSLNAAVAGPELESDSDLFAQFMTDVFRDMTQKAGQKCTATRRIIVPRGLVDAVQEAMLEQLETIQVGNPETEGVSMGPVVSKTQWDSVREGIASLEDAGIRRVFGSSEESDRPGAPSGKGFFIEPALFVADDGEAPAVHAREVFGPVSTILPYDGSPEEAIAILKRGGGGLVASIYSDDKRFVQELVLGAASYHGRLYLCNSKVRDLGAGPGTVLPMMVHGGPGRAGGGEELGGFRGLHHYMQRTAVQGYRPILERLFSGE